MRARALAEARTAARHPTGALAAAHGGLTPRTQQFFGYSRLGRFAVATGINTARAKQTTSPTKGAVIRARIEANREKRLDIADAMKREAGVTGVTGHEINTENFNGLAYLGTGRIMSPVGQNMRHLYIVAHECGHIFLHGQGISRHLPTHVMELEAESYSHQAFREHGITLSRPLSDWGRTYVASWIAKDRAAGIKINSRALARKASANGPTRPSCRPKPSGARATRSKSVLDDLASEALAHRNARGRSEAQTSAGLSRRVRLPPQPPQEQRRDQDRSPRHPATRRAPATHHAQHHRRKAAVSKVRLKSWRRSLS